MDTRVLSIFGDNVGATTVTTLASRAHGAERYPVPGWDDPQARDAFNRLSALAADQGVDVSDFCLRSRSDVAGTLWRSLALDRVTRLFVERTAGRGRPQVVSIGVGLCNRASRLADLDVDWYGVDRPAIAKLRAHVIDDDTVTIVGDDAADDAWMRRVDPHRPTLVIAEGVFMYLTEGVVTELLDSLAAYFDQVELAADVFAKETMPKNKDSRPAAITKLTGSTYSFTANGAQGLAALSDGWVPMTNVDTMSPISLPMRIMSRTFRAVRGHLMFGVAHIRKG